MNEEDKVPDGCFETDDGTRWIPHVTIGVIRRLEAWLGKPVSGQTLGFSGTMEGIWLACKKQAKELGIGRDQFEELLDGHVQAAVAAFEFSSLRMFDKSGAMDANARPLPATTGS